jgi:protein gp37
VSATTTIQWTDATWNPVRGCSRVSAGCLHCYAESVAARFSDPGQPYYQIAERTPQPHWTGKVELVEKHLLDPIRWKRPRRVFVNSMSDLFHEGLPDEAIDRVFAVMALCPQHQFQVLTKRPARMLEYLTGQHAARNGELTTAAGECALVFGRPGRFFPQVKSLPLNQYGRMQWPLPNCWLGVSVENQATADERVPLLQQTPAAIRFISQEPQLDHINWTAESLAGISWLIQGGESGHGARPFDLEWARDTREQCRRHHVKYFFKQAGANVFDSSLTASGASETVRFNSRKGGDMEEWPVGLRIREFPEIRV